MHLRRWWRARRDHLIDIRSPKNGYAGGYIDRSDAIMYANFALLVAFVENEDLAAVDWRVDEATQSTHIEFMLLYVWWKYLRPKEQAVWHQEREDVEAKREALDKKDTEMLHRLIDVRGVLWT